jgi:uncharacterized delta-60 repeat protein
MRTIFTPFFLFLSLSLFAQDGVLDNTFGTGGKVSTSLPGGVIAQERQKITVVAGNMIYQCFTISDVLNGPGDFGLARYNSDGSLDNSFGNNGFARVDMGADDAATCLFVGSDGSITVGGYTRVGSPGVGSFAIAKLSSEGVLDITFDGDGRTVTTIGNDAYAYSLIVQPDARIVLGGFTNVTATGGYDFALVRYLPNGSLDNTFGTGGRVTTSFNASTDGLNALYLQNDGKIVAAGFSNNGTANRIAVARYNANGTLDTGFDGDGLVTTSINGTDDVAMAVYVNNTGRILVGGYSQKASDFDFAMVRYLPNGALDNTFDSDGRVTTDLNVNSSERAFALAVQSSDGKIILAGAQDDGNGDNNFAVVRYLANGSVDVGFGPSGTGITYVDFNGDDIAYSIASQGNNLIIGGVAGGSLALARLVNTVPVVVPVRLTDLTVTKVGAEVLVNWKTASEANTASFEIQRSTDGQRFEAIGQVAAAGNSSTSRSYSFTDRQPAAAVNYYRLRIIDLDGRETISRTVAIRFDREVNLVAYPNPVRNTLNLQVRTAAGPVLVRVLDATGRTVKQQEVRSNGGTLALPLDLSSLNKGVYILSVNGQSLQLIKE